MFGADFVVCVSSLLFNEILLGTVEKEQNKTIKIDSEIRLGRKPRMCFVFCFSLLWASNLIVSMITSKIFINLISQYS